MKFAKWGNSLAVRIPAEIVAKLGFEAGQHVQFEITPDGDLTIGRDLARRRALEELRRLRLPIPDGYVFDRNEIYDDTSVL